MLDSSSLRFETARDAELQSRRRVGGQLTLTCCRRAATGPVQLGALDLNFNVATEHLSDFGDLETFARPALGARRTLGRSASAGDRAGGTGGVQQLQADDRHAQRRGCSIR